MPRDGILWSIWQGIRDGWNAPIETNRSALSVGRGVFANPFLNERDRDLRGVQVLYEQVRHAHARSPFAQHQWLDDSLLEILRRACRSCEGVDVEWAVRVACDPARDLLIDDLVAFPEFSKADWAQFSLRDVVDLRAFLLRREHQLRDPTRTTELACAAVSSAIGHVFNAAGVSATSRNSDDLVLDANVLDAWHAAPERVEAIWRLFLSEELARVGLFNDVREQLWRNAMDASGVALDNARAASKVQPPTKAKGLVGRDLAMSYLGATPLASLFGAHASLSIPQEVRFEHTHIVGGSGHGKSQLLLHLIHHDMTCEEGPGLIVIDSQGDLVRTISQLALFDGPLADRFVLIDPSDVEYPVALSLFDVPTERLATYGAAERERVLNGAIEMYEYVFSSLLGSELTQKQGVIFRFLARLMMVIPGATLHTFLDLMEHGDRFRTHMQELDGTARRFFDDEFFHPSFAATKKQIAKRLWGILANPVFERMFSQPKGKLDFFRAMQVRKIILVSTAKDVLRQEGAEIFGRLVLAKITQAVMERATVALDNRAPCFLYVDEAQEYIDEQMTMLLNQARKYRVGLILAHQNLDQLPTGLRASVMSSTSIKFAGGVSAKDARVLAEDMHTEPSFLQSARKHPDHSQFACFVRNQTPHALKVSVPLGRVSAAPQLSDEAAEMLLQRNRATYAAERVCKTEPRQGVTDALGPSPKQRDEPRFARSTCEQGHGGQRHKYLQHLLRTGAQAIGLKADIEYRTADASIDVVIEGPGRRIACEISITTDTEDETGNVRKCLAAGFDTVWLIVDSARRRAARAKSMQGKLGAEELARLEVFTAEEALAALNAFCDPSETVGKSVRGYSVKVRSSTESTPDKRHRQDALAAILVRSLREKK